MSWLAVKTLLVVVGSLEGQLEATLLCADFACCMDCA
jgi:hypothetical protein